MAPDLIKDERDPQHRDYCGRVIDILVKPCSRASLAEQRAYLVTPGIDPVCRQELLKRVR